MLLNRHTNLGQKSVCQGRNCTNAFIQNNFLDPVEWEKDGCWLDTALLAAIHMINPVLECIQVNSTYRDARNRNLDHPSEKPLVWGLQVDDHDGVGFHYARSTIIAIPCPPPMHNAASPRFA